MKIYFLLKMGMFQCHVSFQGCSFLVNLLNFDPDPWVNMINPILTSLNMFLRMGGNKIHVTRFGSGTFFQI